MYFFLVFTKFPNLNKIVVEVYPPNVENWDKIANYPPQCSTKIGTTDIKCAARRRRERLGEFGVALLQVIEFDYKTPHRSRA